MRKVMLFALMPAFLLAAGVTRPMTTIDRDVRPAVDEPVVRVERSNPVAEPYALVGIVDTVGGTTADWQFNGPMGKYLINSLEHGLHVTWMYSAASQTTYPDRNMRYNFFDYSLGEWNWIDPDFMQSGVNAFTERSGYGTIDANEDGIAYIGGHLGSPLSPEVARDMSPGIGLFEYCNGQPNATAYQWPYMAIDGDGTAQFALIDGASSDRLWYSKVDPWCTWSVPIGVPAPQPDPMFPTHNIAASRVSRKVTITWVFSEGSPINPGFMRTSTDGGASWQNPVEIPIPPNAYGRDTLASFHITSIFPHYDMNDELHIVANVMPYVGGDGFIIPAQIWHWNASNSPAWNRITIATDPNLQAPVGYNAMYACRPTIGEGPDGNIYVAWEQFDGQNVEPGPPELVRADIYAAASADNGQTWTAPLRLTQAGNTSVRFPGIVDRMVDLNGQEHMAVTYLIDQVAGFHVQGEGPATNNPIIVHWVPTSAFGLSVAEPGQGVRPVQLEMAARPNPFGNRTSISYAVPRAGNVSLAVYDAAGRPVRTLVNSRQTAGQYSVNWDGRDEMGAEVSAGIYFYKLTTDQTSITEKLSVIR